LRAIVEELVLAGVRAAVICPGSRSTPLALALRAAPELACHVHLDERAGAYFALGAAKASRRPVAVLATSGTAVVNFAPAVVEARYGRVPLILFTADRPPELQGIGSPQTIDQVELYGRHAKWFAELPVPEASEDVEVETRNAVRRAVTVATTAPAGPVQLNAPFREPLVPVGSLSRVAASDAVDAPEMVSSIEPDAIGRALAAVRNARRPAIVCGPMDVPGLAPAVAALAASIGAPVLADVLSNVRGRGHDHWVVVSRYDALLRSEAFSHGHVPDLVLRFGGTPTSKVLDRWLEGLAAPQLLIDDGAGWNRPAAPTLIGADPVAIAAGLADAAGESSAESSWVEGWRVAEANANAALDAWFAELDEPFEGDVARALDAALPRESVVIAGNSMPVRDLDAFLPATQTPRRWLGNRGASGIDGMLSTALGAAMVQPHPVVAVLGDISFMHDLNALVAARRLGVDATIVLIHNDGGGIFSFLPQATTDLPEAGLPQHYEELFGTPHGVDFGPLVTALDLEHQLVDRATLAEAVRTSMGRAGLDVLELRTDRGRNVALHLQAFAAVARALEESS
jgi:2-succinyl-5-enolpyruvyl-6-hydroxy-3-cyclohexene-1-carboxylate synthase